MADDLTGAGPDTGSASQRIVRAMFVLIFFGVFQRLGGFLLNVVIASLFGASAESDVYLFVCQTVIFGFFYASAMKILTPVLVPLFIERMRQEDEQAAWDFANTVLNLCVIVSSVLVIAGVLLASPIVGTLAAGFGASRQSAAVSMLRLALPASVALVASFILYGLLNSYKVFSYHAAAEAAHKLTWVVLVIVLCKVFKLGLTGVAVGLLLGCAVQLLIALAGLRRKLRYYRPLLPAMSLGRLLREVVWALLAVGLFWLILRGIKGRFTQHKEFARLLPILAAVPCVCLWALWLWVRATRREGIMARFAVLMVPLVLGTALARLRDFSTDYFKSYTPVGVYSDISFAKKVGDLPTLLVAYTLGIAMFPFLCEIAVKKDEKTFGELLTKTFKLLALGFVPITIGTLLLADPVIELLFDRGNWEPFHVHQAGLALRFYILPLVCYAGEHVLMQSFFSLQRMWVPSLAGILATVLHFVILAVPILLLGYDAPMEIFYPVALAYPLTRILKNGFLLLILRRRVPILPLRDTLVFALKLALACAVMTAAVLGAEKYLAPRIPIRAHRRLKIPLENFHPGPATWSSRNALRQSVGVVTHDQASDDPLARSIRLTFRQRTGGEWKAERELSHARLTGVAGFRLKWKSSAALPKPPALEVQLRDGRAMQLMVDGAGTEALASQAESVYRWPDGFDPGAAKPLTARIRISCPTDNASPTFQFEILEFDVEGPAGAMQRLDPPNWSTNAAETRIEEFHDEPAWLLRGSAKQLQATLPVEAMELSGMSMFRAKLASPDGAVRSARVVLESVDGTRHAAKVELEETGWTQLDLPLAKFEALEANASAGGVDASSLVAVRFEAETVGAEEGSGAMQMAISGISSYRPGDILYEALKAVRVALMSGIGAVVFFVSIFVLRMPEVSDLVSWVRNRGWKLRKEIRKKVESGAAGEPPAPMTD